MAKKRVKTGGRQLGTPNKMTSTVKEMILNALEEAGGQEWLVRQATENPVAFMTLLGKILPTQVKAEVGCAVTQITRVILAPGDLEIKQQEQSRAGLISNCERSFFQGGRQSMNIRQGSCNKN